MKNLKIVECVEGQIDQISGVPGAGKAMRDSLEILIQSGIVSDLDAVRLWLEVVFPDWFVYRGGSHVALHRVSDPGFEGRRLFMVVEFDSQPEFKNVVNWYLEAATTE